MEDGGNNCGSCWVINQQSLTHFADSILYTSNHLKCSRALEKYPYKTN